MGVLLRGSAENFNPQVMTEENSLAIKMMKSMALRKKSIELYTRYSRFTSWMHTTGRTNQGAKAGKVTKAANEISDNAYRVSYEGALILPAIAYGAVQLGTIFAPGVTNPDMSGVSGVTYTGGKTVSTITTDTIGSMALKHDPANNIWGDKFNPNDSVILGAGLGIQFIFTSQPRKAADGSHYVVDFKTVGPASDFAPAHLADGEVLTESGNFFGQGSTRGYQRHTKNRWRINYTSIHRYDLTMTGSAKSQKVAWIYNSDDRKSKSWEFSEVLKGEQIFHMMTELSLRYSRISMDPSSHSWYENWGTNQLTVTGFNMETGLTAPVIGDGWIPQIKDNAEFDYDPNSGLAYLYIEAMMMSLANRSPKGSSGNTFVFVTDKVGTMVVDKALKKLLGWGNAADVGANPVSNMSVNIQTGAENEIGFSVTKHHYLNNEVIVMEDELLNNPGLHNTSGGVTGSGNIYCLNMSEIEGVSNFEILARASRQFRKKMIDGMHSFDMAADQSNKASSGFDGCRVALLGECMPVLYDARSCGILRATAKWNGGALDGSAFLTANPDSSSFLY